MKTRDVIDLVALAALWGASFLFMKMGAHEFGAVALAGVRVAMAAAVLLPIVALQGQLGALRQHAGAIVFVGVVNSALPFVGFAFALLVLTAGTGAVLNATAPLWGALVAWAWLGDRPTPWRGLGLAVGFGGVLWLAWDKVGVKGGPDARQVAAGVASILGATLCYGIAATYTKKKLTGVPPMAVAAGSQLSAAVALALPAWWWWPATPPGASAWWAMLALGVLCTALAYLLYFRLIANVGPARAIAVTFLIPVFGLGWGVMLLGERVTTTMVAAGAVILLGTALATGTLAPRGRAAQQRSR